MKRSTALLPGAVGELHPPGDFALQVECQPVLGAIGNRVQVAANGEQEALGAAEDAVFLAREQPGVDQLGGALHAVQVLADPVQRLQVAQAALAVLDVGLDDIAAVTHALVPIVALGQLLGDELRLAARHDVFPEPALGLIVQVLVAPQIAPFEQRSADRQVALGHAHHFVERTARMADLEAEVPQVIEHRLDHLFAPGGGLAGGNEGNIDVRMRRHLAAAVTADRDQREPFARRAIGRRVDVLDHVVVHHPDQLVDEERLAVRRLVTGARMLGQPAGDFGLPVAQGAAQQFDHFGPRLGHAEFGHRRGNRFGQAAPVNYRPLVGYRTHASRHRECRSACNAHTLSRPATLWQGTRKSEGMPGSMLDTLAVTATSAIHWADLGLRPGIPLGFFTLRFYSLAYLAGLLLAYWHLAKMIKAPGAPMAQRHVDDLFFYCTLGVILGGRLGYAFFYTGGATDKPSLFTHFTPGETVSWDLLRLWDGGMSFHGGVLGVLAAIAWVSWRDKLSFIRLADYISVNVGFGMFFGRIANFINGELWGRPVESHVPWAMVFPGGGPIAAPPEPALRGAARRCAGRPRSCCRCSGRRARAFAPASSSALSPR